jgi:hypothetical protein
VIKGQKVPNELGSVFADLHKLPVRYVGLSFDGRHDEMDFGVFYYHRTIMDIFVGALLESTKDVVPGAYSMTVRDDQQPLFTLMKKPSATKDGFSTRAVLRSFLRDLIYARVPYDDEGSSGTFWFDTMTGKYWVVGHRRYIAETPLEMEGQLEGVTVQEVAMDIVISQVLSHGTQ